MDDITLSSPTRLVTESKNSLDKRSQVNFLYFINVEAEKLKS